MNLLPSKLFRQTQRYYHTLKHLKLQQIYYRIWYRISRPSVKTGDLYPERKTQSQWIGSISKSDTWTNGDVFVFQNVTGRLNEIGWDGDERNKLWRYNQHYFDFLNSKSLLSQPVEANRLINNWITCNPVGIGNGWEPYTISLRVVNWIKWSLAGNALTEVMKTSLILQLRLLNQRVEWHILGNHLLANAKALIFGGSYFSGKEPTRWLIKGCDLFLSQLNEQVLPDGGHFERSPMYHAIILEDVLDTLNMLTTYGLNSSCGDLSLIPAMLKYCSAMQHPNGDLPQFNDSAMNVAPTFSQLADYATNLGLSCRVPPESSLEYFPDTGYVKVKNDRACLFIDLAPVGPDYQPGHAHADTLSFELSCGAERVIVNGGTSCYGTTSRRAVERGTALHSTVVIDDVDSSDVWGGFRVGRRANVANVVVKAHAGLTHVSGSHDGYRWLPGAPIHKRTWILSREHLAIEDSLLGIGKHKIDIHFLFHPDLEAVEINKTFLVLQSKVTKRDIVRFDWEGHFVSEICDYKWSPEFGALVSAKKLVLHSTETLPLTHKTHITWIL